MQWARGARRRLWRALPLPTAPIPRQHDGRLIDLGEDAGRRRFLEHYAAVMGVDGPPGSWGAESYADPRDWAEVLVPSARGSTREGPARVDVIVADQRDLPSIRLGLWALLTKTGRP